jgi:hypothetical protein
MTIARKPKQPVAVDVEALIAKGGTPVAQSPAEPAKTKSGPVPVVVRIPADMLVRIEQAVAARVVRVPRHTWILEALAERLERDEGRKPA